MNTSELIAYARRSATIEDNSTEFDDTVCTELLNAGLRSYFEPILEQSRSGRWLHSLTRMLAPGNPYVRIHPRACAIEQVDIRQGTGRWAALEEAIESEWQDWEPGYGSAPVPQVYTVRGSSILLMPAATTDDIQLRAKCTIRPSLLVQEQTAGRVVAVDVTTRVITLDAMPLDRITGTPLSGVTLIDAIEPRGDFELSLFDAPAQVLTSTTLQVGAGPNLGRIEIGDYVRAAGQSDWPQLPESYHTALANAAASAICTRKDMYDRSGELQAVTSAAAQRLASSLTPRVRATSHQPLQHSWRR